MRKVSVLIMSVILLILYSVPCQSQVSNKTSDDKVKEISTNHSTTIEAWRIMMDYVKNNKPHMVNGFLVGSGGGMMGNIVVRKDLSNIDSDAFICTPVKQLKAGETISAFVTQSHSLSMGNVKLKQFAYPFVAMVKSSNGEAFTIFPAVLKAKIDIKTGNVMHLKGFAIETKRPIKAGDKIPVLVIGDNILSVDAVKRTDGSEDMPWFTAFLEKP